jgi:hypothetical protein
MVFLAQSGDTSDACCCYRADMVQGLCYAAVHVSRAARRLRAPASGTCSCHQGGGKNGWRRDRPAWLDTWAQASMRLCSEPGGVTTLGSACYMLRLALVEDDVAQVLIIHTYLVVKAW